MKLVKRTDQNGDQIAQLVASDKTVTLHLVHNAGPAQTPLLAVKAAALNTVSKQVGYTDEHGASPEKQTANLRKIVETEMSAVVKSAVAVIKDTKRANLESKDDLLDPTSIADHAARAEHRAYLRSLGKPKLFATLLKSTDLTLLAAAIEHPDLIELDAALRPQVDERFATLKYMHGPNAPDARAEKPATFDDLAPIEHDYDALEVTAKAKWQALVEVDDHLVYAENFLRQTFVFLAGLAPNVAAKEIYGALDL